MSDAVAPQEDHLYAELTGCLKQNIVDALISTAAHRPEVKAYLLERMGQELQRAIIEEEVSKIT